MCTFADEKFSDLEPVCFCVCVWQFCLYWAEDSEEADKKQVGREREMGMTWNRTRDVAGVWRAQ